MEKLEGFEVTPVEFLSGLINTIDATEEIKTKIKIKVLENWNNPKSWQVRNFKTAIKLVRFSKACPFDEFDYIDSTKILGAVWRIWYFDNYKNAKKWANQINQIAKKTTSKMVTKVYYVEGISEIMETIKEMEREGVAGHGIDVEAFENYKKVARSIFLKLRILKVSKTEDVKRLDFWEIWNLWRLVWELHQCATKVFKS